MQQPALTLMIVDDHPLMRRGVRQLLALDPRLDVIAEANNGTEALAEARRQEPDIILLDLNMGHILQASRGEKVFSEGVASYLDNRQHSADPLRLLTDRECDVLQEVARGLSNKEIAAILHISEETVKVHIRNLLRKLDVRSRVAATVMWLESRK